MTRIRPLFLLVLLCSLPLYARQTVTFGVAGGTTADSAERDMASVMRHLNGSSQLDVQLKVFANHDQLYTALKGGKLDIALLGAVKYVEAHHEFGAEPIVMEGKRAQSSIVVASSSPVTKVAELRGKRVAFGYEDSTTTNLIPLLILSKHGLKAADVKGSFVGHHPQELVDQTLAGKFDATVTSDTTLKLNKDKVRVLETSDPFPGPPVTSRKGLPTPVVKELRRLFLSYSPGADPAGRFAGGVTNVTNADYNRIRFLCKVLFNKMYQ